jgi:hypothetical protein
MTDKRSINRKLNHNVRGADLRELKVEAPAGIIGYKPIRKSSGCRCRLTERLNGHVLVVHDVEDGIEPCNLHHIMNLIREVEQLQFSLLLPHACESTDQVAQA